MRLIYTTLIVTWGIFFCPKKSSGQMTPPTSSLTSPTGGVLSPVEVVYGWKTIDFEFKSQAHREGLIEQKKFVPHHVAIAGLKVSGQRLFTSIGRFLPGTPVTLATVPYNFFEISTFKQNEPNGPPLLPFPSWEMQEIGNCSALQMVQSMEIDQFNRLWVIDVGKSDVITPSMVTGCPAKLIVFDLNDKDRIVRWHEFPDDVVPVKSGAILEISVACQSPDDCWTYIGDIFSESVVVYDFQRDQSWTAKHKSMKAEDGNFTIFGKPFNWRLGVDGMALSPLIKNFDTLYYTPLAGYTVYSVPTKLLQNLPSSMGTKDKKSRVFNLPDSAITKVGQRQSICDGFAMDANGRLFMGANEQNSILWWDSFDPNGQFYQNLLAHNDQHLVWSDTLAFDQRGYLLAITNRFHEAPQYDWNLINFKVVRIFVGAQGHCYLPCEGRGKVCKSRR